MSRSGAAALFAVLPFLFGGPEPDAERGLSVKIEEIRYESEQRVSCTWTARNPTSKSLYVYSTFLSPQGHSMVVVERTGTMLILTTETIPVRALPAYYYPPPEFIEVPPGREIRGNLQRIVRFEERSRRPQRARMVVGYGFSTAEVIAAVAAAERAGLEYQANAIVRWQKLAYSDEIPIQMGHPPKPVGMREGHGAPEKAHGRELRLVKH